MIRNIIIGYFLLTLTSCIEESGSTTRVTLLNNSGHSIELQEFRSGEFQSSIVIGINQNKEYNIDLGMGGSLRPYLPPFDNADSVWIIYYEKASIWHTTDESSPVSRSLMLESSYEGGKTGDKTYEDRKSTL